MKTIDKQPPSDLTYGRGYVYNLQYHIIWCTKYRHPVLVNGIDEDCKEMLKEIAEDYRFTINAIEVMPEHIHLLVKCSPQFCIPSMMKIMKGNIARKLFIKHPELKDSLWGGHLWNPSYCILTVSERSTEQITEYINSQKDK